MKKNKIILLITLHIIPFTLVNGQGNLVENGGFEYYNYCPPFIFNLGFPCINWTSPNEGTPDYYNSCSRDSALSVPLNFQGYFPAKEGSGYIGLMLISLETAGMEYIQGKLKTKLIKDRKYRVSFWVQFSYNLSDYSTDNIGVLMSRVPKVGANYTLSLDNYTFIQEHQIKATVKNMDKKFLTDTSWTEISDEFIAIGGEEYITIGMFYEEYPGINTSLSKIKKSKSYNKRIKCFREFIKKYSLKRNVYQLKSFTEHNTKISQHFPYYFIDNVSVIEVK